MEKQRNFIAAAIGALLIGSGIGNAQAVPRNMALSEQPTTFYRPARHRSGRTRFAGKHKPAGAKLARKALEGAVGLARLR